MQHLGWGSSSVETLADFTSIVGAGLLSSLAEVLVSQQALLFGSRRRRGCDACSRSGWGRRPLMAHAVCGDLAQYRFRFCGLGAKLFARSAEWAVCNSDRCNELPNGERLFTAF